MHVLDPAHLLLKVVSKQPHYGLGIDDMKEVLINATWKTSRLKGLEQLILKQNEQLLLTYLLYISINDNASFATTAAVAKGIDEIKTLVNGNLKTGIDKGYSLLTLERIKAPEKAKPTLYIVAPPGSPIGCDMD